MRCRHASRGALSLRLRCDVSKPVNSLGKTIVDACMRCKETARGERAILKEENARLKRASERDADVIESLNLSLEKSQAENENLSELASKLLYDADGTFSCYSLRGEKCKKMPECIKLGYCYYEKIADEIGIEVE